MRRRKVTGEMLACAIVVVAGIFLMTNALIYRNEDRSAFWLLGVMAGGGFIVWGLLRLVSAATK